MNMYTNLGLVKHAKMALSLKTKYMWGGILRTIEQQFAMLYSMYGSKIGTGYTPQRWEDLRKLCGQGWYGVDCVGLVKSYYWSGKPEGGVGSPMYGASGYPDVNANVMYNQASVKGSITNMPEIPGLIVYSKSHPHVGIYIGNGYTIESTFGSRGDGVVKRKLDNFWEYWFECPYIEYINDKPAVEISEDTANIYQAISHAAIRSAPSKSAEMYGRVTKYDLYPADKKYSTGWFRHAGQEKYSKLEDGGSLFSKVGEYEIKTTVAKLNVRSAPTTKADKLGLLANGTKVYTFKGSATRNDGFTWYKIVFNGKTGYVAGEYLR